MNFRKVTAIIQTLTLEKVIEALKKIGVSGLTVTTVDGYGEYRNLYKKDEMCECSRVEIFTDKDKTKQIVSTIAKTAHLGLDSDGVIAVLPVEDFFHVHEFEEVEDDGK